LDSRGDFKIFDVRWLINMVRVNIVHNSFL